MVALGSVITATTGPTANTEYTIKIEAKSGSQKMYINGSQVISKTYTTTSTSKSNLFLYGRNASTKVADTTVYLRSCKIWVDNVLQRHFEVYLAHANSHDKSGLYDSVTKNYYNISGAFNFYDSKARKIKKIYVGVSNKARKVKKVYVGVNGKAKICYLLNGGAFTGTPVPTVWDDPNKDSADDANTVYMATNSYGTWKCYADVDSAGKYHAHNLFGNEQYQGTYSEWRKHTAGSRFCVFRASRWSTNSTKNNYIMAI